MNPPEVQLQSVSGPTKDLELRIREHPRAQEIRSWVEEHLPRGEESISRWSRYVLAGYASGLLERRMRLDDARHLEPIERILEDVRGLHAQLSASQLNEPALWAQVFDFGIQWAYYLDWRLYLSQDLY
ncbi:MAG: hypothetical protein ACO4AU_11725 [bacterium]|jgi:hypothetical protein